MGVPASVPRATMISAPPIKSAALLILQQANTVPNPDQQSGSVSSDIAATANGVISGADSQSGRVEAKVAEAYFDANAINANALKINLMERLGAELGISLDDFETHAEFGAAVQEAIRQIKLQNGGALRLMEMERKLGLNKLGISLDTLVGAIVDSGSEDAAELEAALRKELGEDESGGGTSEASAALANLRQDEDGLYTR